MDKYLQPAISNGNPAEQALIRRWWHEEEAAAGRLVWEYYLDGFYADAIWFPQVPSVGEECSGKDAPRRFPLGASEVVLCEAKLSLTPELVGQALVYSVFARTKSARLLRTIVFAEKGRASVREAAKALGLFVVIGASAPEPPNELP